MSGFFDDLERQLVALAEAGRPLPAHRRTWAAPFWDTRRLAAAVSLGLTAAVVALGLALPLGGERGGRRPAPPVGEGARSGSAPAQAREIAWAGQACSGCYLVERGAQLGGEASGSSSAGWATSVNVGGGNLEKICIWLIGADGRVQPGSTCNVQAGITIGRSQPATLLGGPPEPTRDGLYDLPYAQPNGPPNGGLSGGLYEEGVHGAVIPVSQGFAAGNGEVALAGGGT